MLVCLCYTHPTSVPIVKEYVANLKVSNTPLLPTHRLHYCSPERSSTILAEVTVSSVTLVFRLRFTA